MTRQLGDLEAVIMNPFWDRSGSMTVRDVLEELSEDRKTEVGTMSPKPRVDMVTIEK